MVLNFSSVCPHSSISTNGLAMLRPGFGRCLAAITCRRHNINSLQNIQKALTESPVPRAEDTQRHLHTVNTYPSDCGIGRAQLFKVETNQELFLYISVSGQIVWVRYFIYWKGCNVKRLITQILLLSLVTRKQEKWLSCNSWQNFSYCCLLNVPTWLSQNFLSRVLVFWLYVKVMKLDYHKYCSWLCLMLFNSRA